MRLGKNTYQIFYAPEGVGTGAAPSEGTGATPPAGNADPKAAGGQKPELTEPTWLPDRLARAERKAAQQAAEKIFGELGSSPDELPALKEQLEKLRSGESEAKKIARERDKFAKESSEQAKKIAQLEAQERDRQAQGFISGELAKLEQGGKHTWRSDLLISLLSGKPLPQTIGFHDGKIVVLENGEPVRDKDAAKFISAFIEACDFFLKPVGPGAGSRVASSASNGGSRQPLDLIKATAAEKKSALTEELMRQYGKGK